MGYWGRDAPAGCQEAARSGSHRPSPFWVTLHPSPRAVAAVGVGDWPGVPEQLQRALGPSGMREPAAHQDFYGNLLLARGGQRARGGWSGVGSAQTRTRSAELEERHGAPATSG